MAKNKNTINEQQFKKNREVGQTCFNARVYDLFTRKHRLSLGICDLGNFVGYFDCNWV